jgi:hypothetical protein
LAPETLAVEHHAGEIWLVLGDTLLARFRDMDCVAEFWSAYNRAMLVAREVGRQGIG